MTRVWILWLFKRCRDHLRGTCGREVFHRLVRSSSSHAHICAGIEGRIPICQRFPVCRGVLRRAAFLVHIEPAESSSQRPGICLGLPGLKLASACWSVYQGVLFQGPPPFPAKYVDSFPLLWSNCRGTNDIRQD